MTPTLVALLTGYLLGCIQTAYLLGKLVAKRDIRHLGTGNAGASNMTAVFGFKFGAVTAVVDILKSTAAVLIFKWLYPEVPELAYVAGIGAILGHIFPFYLKFSGGKGVAALLGMMFGVDWRLGILFILLFVIPALATDFIVIGSFATYLAFPVVTLLLGFHWIYVVVAAAMTVLCFYKHRGNIRRLIAKEEARIGSVLKSRASLKKP